MIRIQAEPFDIAAELAALTGGRTDLGAVVTFTGLVRDITNNTNVERLTLEHYPGMTEKELARIEIAACDRFGLSASRIVHRVGTLEPGDPIVLVIACAAHRDAAFDGARFMMDFLKTEAPFWKKEGGQDNTHWVEARASDDAARDRWK
jgi:molybdopterin synthase catalytic subunit